MAFKKKYLFILPVLFMSVSCGLTRGSTVAGISKTVNGGVDWQFSNSIQDSDATISNLNVSRLAFDPFNREIVYAGGYNGGLYKSEDSGATWRVILSRIQVYNFSVHPSDPKIIYVAGIFADSGKVLKTADGGATWQEVYNEAGQSNPVRAVTLDPLNPNQLLAGTGSGTVIVSSDGGISWRFVNSFEDRVNAILWQNNAVYVLLQTKGLLRADNPGGEFKSVTAGLVRTPFQGTAIASAVNVRTFHQAYIDPLAPSLLYVTTDKGLFKSVDGGGNWNMLALPAERGDGAARAIAVSRDSSNVIYTSVGATVYKSTDGGFSWQTQLIPTQGFVNYILIDPVLPQIVYAGIYGND